jgi:hypothetical protein
MRGSKPDVTCCLAFSYASFLEIAISMPNSALIYNYLIVLHIYFLSIFPGHYFWVNTPQGNAKCPVLGMYQGCPLLEFPEFLGNPLVSSLYSLRSDPFGARRWGMLAPSSL